MCIYWKWSVAIPWLTWTTLIKTGSRAAHACGEWVIYSDGSVFCLVMSSPASAIYMWDEGRGRECFGCNSHWNQMNLRSWYGSINMLEHAYFNVRSSMAIFTVWLKWVIIKKGWLSLWTLIVFSCLYKLNVFAGPQLQGCSNIFPDFPRNWALDEDFPDNWGLFRLREILII